MVNGFVVGTHAISDQVEVPGSLLPFEETEIRAEVSGRVVELNIPEGAVVGARAVVTASLSQTWTVYSGNPCRQVGLRKQNLKK